MLADSGLSASGSGIPVWSRTDFHLPDVPISRVGELERAGNRKKGSL